MLNRHQQLAGKVLAAIEEIDAMIPDLRAPLASALAFVRGHCNVSEDFVRSAIAAAEQHPEMRGIHKLDPAEAREALQFIEAFGPVADRLRLLQRSVTFTMNARYASLAADSQQLYAILKGISRDPAAGLATAHVETMRRHVPRRGRRRGSDVRPAPEEIVVDARQ